MDSWTLGLGGSVQNMNFWVALLAILLPMTSFAGGEVSGGGASFVCRTSKGNITSAYLIDLYEAENDSVHPLRILRSQKSPEDQIDEMFLRWEKSDADVGVASFDIATLRRALAIVKRDRSDMKSGTRLAYVPDVNPVFVPKKQGCHPETTAHYDDKNHTLRIDMEIFKKLSFTDQAALIVHEAAYKVNRLFSQDRTSENTRKMVARLFAEGKHSAHFEKSLMNLGTYPDSFTLQMNPELFDILLGGKKLDCQMADDSKATIQFLSYKETRENNEEYLPLDQLSIKSEGTLAWGGDDPQVTIERVQIPGVSLAHDVLSISSTGAEGSEIQIPIHDLVQDAIYTSNGKVQANATYSYFPERGDGDVKDASIRCGMR